MTPNRVSWILCLNTQRLEPLGTLESFGTDDGRLVLFPPAHHPGVDRLANVHVIRDLRTRGKKSTLCDGISTSSATFHRQRGMGLQSHGTTGRGIHRAQPGTADGVSLPRQGTGLTPLILAAHQTGPRNSLLRVSRPGLAVRHATCGATRGPLEEHCHCPHHYPREGPRVLGVTAVLLCLTDPFVVRCPTVPLLHHCLTPLASLGTLPLAS